MDACRQVCLGLAAAVLAAIAAAPGAAASFPNRPIRLIVSFPPGGATDTIARVLQPGLEKHLGQPVVIENKAGAGGVIGIAAVAHARPDGYTVGFGGAGALAVSASLGEKMPYNPLRDLSPITLVGVSPFILAAARDFPAKTLDEAIAAAKAKPGEISIGHGGAGTSMSLTATLLNSMAGIDLTLVPYRGMGPLVADVVAGHVPLAIVDGPSALNQIHAGQIRPLAVSSLARMATLPEVPTFDERGLTGFESIGWYGIVAPAKTPPAIVAKLNDAFVEVLSDLAVIERIRAAGAEPRPMRPEEFARYIRGEIAKWREVARRAGIRPN